MKKLLFLLPIAGWIGCYFLWSYSGQFMDGGVTNSGLWWLLTDFLAVGITAASLKVAIDKNQ